MTKCVSPKDSWEICGISLEDFDDRFLLGREICPVCKSPYVTPVRYISPQGLPRRYLLRGCLECHSFWNSPSPWNAVAPVAEQPVIYRAPPTWHISVAERNHLWAAQLFSVLASIKSFSSVLEIGCGIGSALHVAAQLGKSVLGYDINLDAVEYGREKFGISLQAELWDQHSISEKYDLILCISTLEHFTEPLQMLHELASYCKKNGSILFISVPFVEKKHLLTADPQDIFNPFRLSSAHFTHFSKKGFETAISPYGCKLQWVSAGWSGYLCDFTKEGGKGMSFGYSPPGFSIDQFRIATCNDLIWLKSRHREFLQNESLSYEKKHYGLGWGLKALGRYYILEYLKQFRPARVLEIGAGVQMFFSERCRELGLEYWMCDDGGEFFSEDDIKKHAKRADTNFVYGQVGQYLEALPADYFDLVLSVSVVEHVLSEKLNDFYGDIKRMIKSAINGGRMIHTIDLPHLPGFKAQLRHLRAARQVGFIVPSESQFLQFQGVPLFEPLEHQYIYYSGKDRDMWGEEMTNVRHQYSTVIFNSSISHSGAGAAPKYAVTLQKEVERLCGQEVCFWGMGDIYQRNKTRFAHVRQRCILVDMERDGLPNSVDGIPVRHPKEVLSSGDILPIVIFVQNINAVYTTIREQYPAYTDLVFVPY